MEASYRGIIAAALEQIEDGLFTFASSTNLYLALAVQKRPPPSVAAWWDEVLLTIRDVLATWPWDPTAQAWIERPAPASHAKSPEGLPDGAPLAPPDVQTGPSHLVQTMSSGRRN